MGDDNPTSAPTGAPTPFAIAGFAVEPGRNLVSSGGQDQSLEPRIMDVLCHLAAHPGQVMSRSSIIDAVWGRAHGADESLTRAISRLRKVFGDTRAPPWLIETVPKRGYRLIAPVRWDQLTDRPDRRSKATVARAPRAGRQMTRWGLVILAAALFGAVLVGRRPWPARATDEGIFVTVLPFEGSGDAMNGQGKLLAGQIAASLSQASLLRVQREDRGAAGSWKGAYGYVIHGVMQRSAGAVRVTVGLDDAATNVTLWSGQFERGLDPSGRDDLPGTIAAELDNRLLSAAKSAIRKKPAQALKPWELTLLATWVPGSDEVFLAPHTADALWPQQRALALDPRYAPAHASLASALAYRVLFTSNLEGSALLRQAKSHAEQARARAPYDPGVLYELATYYRLVGDRTGALAALDRVVALQPDHPTARWDRLFLADLCTARAPGALAGLDQALDAMSAQNPARWVLLSHIADLQLARGDFDRARQAAEQSRQIVPMTWSGATLAASASALGDAATARQVSRQTRLEWPDLDWTAFAATGVDVWCLHGPEGAGARTAFNRLGQVDPLRR